MTDQEKKQEIKRLRREARDRRAEAEGFYRRIERLDGSDPEDRDAARDWRRIAWHSEDVANEADRYADRLQNELEAMQTTDTTTIEYSYLLDCRLESGEWTGSENAAVARAAEELAASELESGDYAYRAEETDTYYTVDRGELAELGAALLDGREMSDVYSIWCSSAGHESDVSEVAELRETE